MVVLKNSRNKSDLGVIGSVSAFQAEGISSILTGRSNLTFFHRPYMVDGLRLCGKSETRSVAENGLAVDYYPSCRRASTLRGQAGVATGP